MKKLKPIKAWAILRDSQAWNAYRLEEGQMIYRTKREATEEQFDSLGERVARIEIREIDGR